MLRVGITGGIGSGKSTVAALFATRGVPIIDADEIARRIVVPGESGYADIVRLFGDGILAADGTIDRVRLRDRVFRNEEERRELEAILHPKIRAEMLRAANNLSFPYCLFVIPLLIESQQQGLCDRILVVDTSQRQQMERVMARGLARDEVERILVAQTSREERLRYANDCIENSGDLQQLERQVQALHERYLALARDTPHGKS